MSTGLALQLTVPNLACEVCVKTVTIALQSLDSKVSVVGDPATKMVSISLSSAFTSSADQPEASVRAALAAAGYPAD